MSGSKKVFKWFMIVLGTLVFLFVAAAIIVPLVVDVDKYRPQIEQVADQHLNGKLELGKLKLSLWGQIRVEVDGVRLTDARGHDVVSVKDSYFHVGLASILSGSPVLTFQMNQPAVNVVKDREGKLNLMSLMKQAPAQAQAKPGTPAQPAQPAQPSGKSVTLPAIATRARMGVELQNALVNYKDEKTGMTTQVKDLNFVVKDISLSRPIEMSVWADLDTKMGTMVVRGPARMDARAEPKLNGTQFESAKVTMHVNLDDLEILMPGLFEKHKGIPANADGSFSTSAKEARIENLEIRFHNADVKVTGAITQLGGEPAAPGKPAPSPVVNVDVKSNEIALKPWNELVPMLKDYDMGGTMDFSATAQGPADKLGYKADLAVKDLTAKAPKLKAEPRIDGTVHVTTDRIDDMHFTMKAPGNDLDIRGKMVSFTQPQIDMTVTSSGMDLDQLIVFPPPAPKGAATPAKTSAAPTSKAGPAADYDAMVAPMRKNKMLAATKMDVSVAMKMLKAHDIQMTDISGKMTFKDLVGAIEKFQMGLWGGVIKSSSSVNLGQATPSYHFSAEVDHLDMRKAVASQVALFKNTVYGTANFKMSGQGASFNPEPAMSNLNAKGNFKIDNATFATIDVGKMANEAVAKAIDKVAEKFPQIKDRAGSVKAPNREERYDSISANFSIANGKFSMPDFLAKAAPHQGIDIKGDTTVGLKDNSLSTTWTLVDTYDFTHAYDLSVPVAGTTINHIFSEGGKPVQFPVHAGCTTSAPCYSYAAVPGYLAGVALNNASRAATGRAKQELKNQASKLIQKAPPSIQNKLNDLKNKFFH